jgi:hypothetical protein
MSMRPLSFLLFLGLAPIAAEACSACGCTLDTDDAVATAGSTGLRVDGRFDYVNQNELLLGGKTPGAADLDPTQREVQHQTRNYMMTLGIDYSFDGPWGVNLAIPVFDRFHTSYSDPDNPGILSGSKWTELSDVRLLGRYTGLDDSRNYGILFGLKLPTGDTRTNFSSGTVAGTPLDRGLQPGSGTTDLLLGFTQTGQFGERLSWFATELWQKPLNDHDDFRPGQTLNANLGLRYQLDETLTPQLQINAQNRWRDSGAQSDRANSGGEVIYVSPGLTVNLGEGTSVYGFVQLPVYQRVGGLELVPTYTASVGVSHSF